MLAEPCLLEEYWGVRWKFWDHLETWANSSDVWEGGEHLLRTQRREVSTLGEEWERAWKRNGQTRCGPSSPMGTGWSIILPEFVQETEPNFLLQIWLLDT